MTHPMLRRISAILALAALLSIFVLAGGALAADAPNTDGQVVVDHTVQIVQVFSLLVGVFLPLGVGLVTRVVTSEAKKAWLLAGLSAVSGFLTTFINDPHSFNWFQAVLTALTTFVVAVAMHFGLWKPTGVAANLQAAGPIR